MKAPTKKVWSLYKAPTLDALAYGLEACELGGWTTFQILDSYNAFTIVAFKVVPA